MGLMIHSLGELPIEAKRGYYIYLLDYGWKEPLGEALFRNFSRMAKLASQNNAVVLRGIVGSHFDDEVLSWHHINGQDAENILPAILITTRNPHEFDFARHDRRAFDELKKHNLILVPLNNICKSAKDVADLIDQIFKDIQHKKSLKGFKVVKRMRTGIGGAITDALILQPNFAGVGIDVKKILNYFKKGMSSIKNQDGEKE